MWMYTFPTLERLTIHWIDNGNTEAASVLLGHLDAHGWGARATCRIGREPGRWLPPTPI